MLEELAHSQREPQPEPTCFDDYDLEPIVDPVMEDIQQRVRELGFSRDEVTMWYEEFVKFPGRPFRRRRRPSRNRRSRR